MSTLREIQQRLELEVVSAEGRLDREVSGGYASDLLSCAMSHAREGALWVTLQSHVNVVAVAGLVGMAGVLITEGARPDAETIARAEEHGVPLLLTARSTYAVVCELTALGVGDGSACVAGLEG